MDFPVIFAGQIDERYERALLRLRGFANMQKGWNFGHGQPAAAYVIAAAYYLLDQIKFSRLPKYDVFPGDDGEVEVVVYEQGVDYSFEIQPDLSIRYRMGTGDEAYEMKLDEAVETIRGFSPVWNLYDTFTSHIGISNSTNLDLQRLRRLPTGDFPFLGRTALLPSQTMSVYMPQITFPQTYAPPHQSFGDLTLETSQPLAKIA
jgi:hypothetical protein